MDSVTGHLAAIDQSELEAWSVGRRHIRNGQHLGETDFWVSRRTGGRGRFGQLAARSLRSVVLDGEGFLFSNNLSDLRIS